MTTWICKNPATEEVVGMYPLHSREEAVSILETVSRAGDAWRRVSWEERAKPFRNIAAQLRAQKEKHAALMTREMGKPVTQSLTEVEKCAAVCEFYADEAPKLLASIPVPTEAARSFVSFQPLGTILAIMPWNFPYWQVFRFAAPTLMAGNSALLKHAPITSGCAAAIEKLFLEAGFPENLLRVVRTPDDVTNMLISDSPIAAVTLTGSTRAGRAVAQTAGAALKKCVLELGGSDPFVVLEDADLDLAVNCAMTSRFNNSGQSCIAAKRFIVVDSVFDDFQNKILAAITSKKTGDPALPETEIGPLARADLRENLHRQVEASVAAGARLLAGGIIPPGRGYFYPPTLLSEVRPGMTAFDEELFGPVATLIRAKNESHALELANQTDYGLGASVFTKNQERGERIAEQILEAGSCFVNAVVHSDSRLPFGGIKKSGFGRELSGFGIHEFVNIKTVYRA